MIRTVKPRKSLVLQACIPVTFKKLDSLVLQVTGMFLGSVPACNYCKDPNQKKNPWVVQCHLPDFKVIIGHYPTEDDAKKACLKVASLFCQRLNSEF